MIDRINGLDQSAILAGIRLLQKFSATPAQAVLTDSGGTPSQSASTAIMDLLDMFGPPSIQRLDDLYALVATRGATVADNTCIDLLSVFDARFGEDVEQDAPINGADAVDWISSFTPRVREALQDIGVPASEVPPAPSVQGLLAQFLWFFGDAVESDAAINAADAVDWISLFAPRARTVLREAIAADDRLP